MGGFTDIEPDNKPDSESTAFIPPTDHTSDRCKDLSTNLCSTPK